MSLSRQVGVTLYAICDEMIRNDHKIDHFVLSGRSKVNENDGRVVHGAISQVYFAANILYEL